MVLLFVYGFQLVLRFSGVFTIMEGEGKEFVAYFEDGNLLRLQVLRSHSPTMDTELFRVILRFTLSQRMQHQKQNFLIQ